MRQFEGARWARWLLRLFGWRVEFNGLPADKGVIIAYPHTSNWDFVVGILAKWGIGIGLNFWAKEALFTGVSRYTLGPLMRAWGAIPVDRHSSQGMIEQTLAAMRERDYFWLALAPEGTRKHQPYLRTGFYRVALAAQVPLGLAYFDFTNKRVGVTEFITLTGDEAADLARIAAHYKGIRGANPELAAPIRFKPQK